MSASLKLNPGDELNVWLMVSGSLAARSEGGDGGLQHAVAKDVAMHGRTLHLLMGLTTLTADVLLQLNPDAAEVVRAHIAALQLAIEQGEQG